MLKDPEDRAPANQNPCPHRLGSCTLIYSRGTETSLVGRGGAWYTCRWPYRRLSARFVIWMLTEMWPAFLEEHFRDWIVLCLTWFCFLMRQVFILPAFSSLGIFSLIPILELQSGMENGDPSLWYFPKPTFLRGKPGGTSLQRHGECFGIAYITARLWEEGWSYRDTPALHALTFVVCSSRQAHLPSRVVRTRKH